MKIAILGVGPLAVEATSYFYDLGADVRWFTSGLNPLGLLQEAKELESFGLPLPASVDFSSWSTYQEWLEKKVEFLNPYIRPVEVQRVHKCTLGPGEVPVGRSRMADLFRVVYKVLPELESVKDESELENKLGAEILESLKNPLEQFEDFDFVLDVQGFENREFASHRAYAKSLNEDSVPRLIRGYEGLIENGDSLKTSSELALIQPSIAGIDLIKGVLSQLIDEKIKIHLVFREANPFEDQKSAWEEIQAELKAAWAQKFEAYKEKLKDWEALEDYVKVKIPKPKVPGHPIELYPHSGISSFDFLTDRKQLYCTLESTGLLNQTDEEEKESHRTFPVDFAFNEGSGLRRLELYKSLMVEQFPRDNFQLFHPEPGFYTLGPWNFFDLSSTFKSRDHLPQIKEDILKYFSRSS